MGVQIHVRKKKGQLLFRLYHSFTGRYCTPPLSKDECAREYVYAKMLGELPLREKDVLLFPELAAKQAEQDGELDDKWEAQQRGDENEEDERTKEIYASHQRLCDRFKPLLMTYLQELKAIEAKYREK